MGPAAGYPRQPLADLEMMWPDLRKARSKRQISEIFGEQKYVPLHKEICYWFRHCVCVCLPFSFCVFLHVSVYWIYIMEHPSDIKKKDILAHCTAQDTTNIPDPENYNLSKNGLMGNCAFCVF